LGYNIKELGGYVVRMGGIRNAYRILVEKPEGNVPLGRQD